jgi:hypothetical protein
MQNLINYVEGSQQLRSPSFLKQLFKTIVIWKQKKCKRPEQQLSAQMAESLTTRVFVHLILHYVKLIC